MKMIVAGGGTGGHLFPGLAVAEALATGDSALFVGSSEGIEARVIPQTGFPFRAVDIRGVRGRGFRGVIDFVTQVPVALRRAGRELAEFGAEVVVGVGGYASFPAVAAAWMRGIPIVLLEQNAHPGLANRVLARVASKVCTSFAAAADYFPAGKICVTGNPVRALGSSESGRRGSGFGLLVFGGSQGAQSINQAICSAVARLDQSIDGLRVIHQTGRGAAGPVCAAYERSGVDAEVHEFIEDMGAAYANADLVVCRSGATTLAELALLGKAAILVPYPAAADDHQRSNAEVVADGGAARVLLDAELSGDALAAIIEEIAGDRDLLLEMERASRSMAVPDAAARVVEVCRGLVGGPPGEPK